MGRGKVHWELINNEKKRKATFRTRKDCLLKKALQLSTLCDINVSVIISTDDHQQPGIFHTDPPKSNGVIDLYKELKKTDPGKICYFGLSEFFHGRKTKIEEELAKARNKNRETKYPTWFDFLNKFSEAQLREFALGLESKIDVVKSEIESLKSSKIQNRDHHAFYPSSLSDDQRSFVKPLINPRPSPMVVYDPADLFGDRNNIIMQSEKPNSDRKSLTSQDDKDFYDYVNFCLESPSSTFWDLPEIPELPPFMHMNSPSTTDFSSFITEYDAGANGIDDYHYLV